MLISLEWIAYTEHIHLPWAAVFNTCMERHNAHQLHDVDANFVLPLWFEYLDAFFRAFSIIIFFVRLWLLSGTTQAELKQWLSVKWETLWYTGITFVALQVFPGSVWYEPSPVRAMSPIFTLLFKSLLRWVWRIPFKCLESVLFCVASASTLISYSRQPPRSVILRSKLWQWQVALSSCLLSFP